MVITCHSIIALPVVILRINLNNIKVLGIRNCYKPVFNNKALQ